MWREHGRSARLRRAPGADLALGLAGRKARCSWVAFKSSGSQARSGRPVKRNPAWKCTGPLEKFGGCGGCSTGETVATTNSSSILRGTWCGKSTSRCPRTRDEDRQDDVGRGGPRSDRIAAAVGRRATDRDRSTPIQVPTRESRPGRGADRFDCLRRVGRRRARTRGTRAPGPPRWRGERAFPRRPPCAPSAGPGAPRPGGPRAGSHQGSSAPGSSQPRPRAR